MRKNLVLIPGLLCSRDLWRDQITHFEGGYDITLCDHTRHDDLPDMVADFLTAAPDVFHLAGLSMGGYIAFEVMRQAPDRVEKLILLDSNARADRQPQIDLRAALIRRAQTEDIREIARELTEFLIHERRMKDKNLCARILDMATEVGAPAFQRQQRALIGRPDSRNFLGQITCPALIICGDGDRLTPPKVHREMAELITDSELHIIPGCGHLSTMECPDEVNRLMAAFLRD